MYSKIKNIQILLSLLKQHNVRHIVLSAGTRHVPIAHSVENDPFFKCYSVVDERSAGYYALGIARETGEKVAIACTSSTATCNYTPAVAEAFYQNIPLLILTGDRDPYRLGQLEDQMIDQVDMYGNFCRKCVNLPVVNNDHDAWYCSRLVNEALLELDHRGGGPVQINFPIVQSLEDIADASATKLPAVRKISRTDAMSPDSEWDARMAQLAERRRVLVLCGSALPADDDTVEAMRSFAEKYNCVFCTEKVSNLHFEGALDTYLTIEALSDALVESDVNPDLVIFFGGNFISRWKTKLRNVKRLFGTWLISPDGAVMDPFENLEEIFECTPGYFFRRACQSPAAEGRENDRQLYNYLAETGADIEIPSMEELTEAANRYRFSEQVIGGDAASAFGTIKCLTGSIPGHSLLHLSILNSTRITQFFPLPEDVTVYSNIGTDGIDGCMSTFLGQSAVSDRECFLVVGDLSFFYDMNSVSIRNIGRNVHILLINNGGGAEFYFSMGPARLPNIDLHISAAHEHTARAWVEANGFKYMTASLQSEVEELMPQFAAGADVPVFFEVFTQKQSDVDLLKSFQRYIYKDTAARSVAKKISGMPIVRKVLDSQMGSSIKNAIKKHT